MRTKDEIMELVVNKSKKAAFPDEIKRIHSLYTLEMLIDIRDSLLGLDDRLSELYNVLQR